MNTPHVLAAAVTILFVFGLVVFRVAWGASQMAAGSALGRFKLPRSWQRRLFAEHNRRAA